MAPEEEPELARTRVRRKRVFVSFDFDNDQALKILLIGQSRNKLTNFDLADWSLKEVAPQRTWESAARARIKRSDIVLVLVGSRTHRAAGVLKEVKMAREENIQIVQVRQADSVHIRVPDAGRLYIWNWPNLERLLNFLTLRPKGRREFVDRSFPRSRRL